MPTYNAVKYISETIESILDQTYENWELIIVDDCSVDETISVIGSYTDDRIRLVKLSE
ncbi:MAG: glycosyltransferase, partial [Tetragenococcus koreensis]|nr:glycosyltransferase [Tetragenococcus koreensis]